MLFTKKPEEESAHDLPANSRSAPGAGHKPHLSKTRSVIDPGLLITGTLEGDGELQIDGHVRGDIRCTHLTVGSAATVDGNITADEVVVAARVVRFTDPAEVTKRKKALTALIQQAIDVEKAGKKVETVKNPEPMPEELIKRFAEDAELQAAFAALTPGRQRGYILHFSQPKQSRTREARIEKCRPKILEGKGFFD